jgi:DivIVA domain-containing protein
MEPGDVARKEFPVVLRGYSQDQVRGFIAALAAEMAERDAHIAALEAEIARRQARLQEAAPAGLPAPAMSGRAELLRRLGEEAGEILEAGDIAAGRLRSEAEATAERVRRDLAAIGAGLRDTHRRLGEIVGVVQSATGQPASPAPVPSPATLLGGADVEILLPDDSDAPRFG